jgi:riboflavin kinase/FMN adenylyltransferase
MRLVETIADLPASARGAVAAIGNFDGVHLGHRAVLEATVALARRLGRPAGVITFEPHPRRFFRPAEPPFRLTPAPAKRRLVAGLGCDLYYELKFDAALAGLSAEAFIDTVLAEGLGISHIVVGDGFVFGKGRGGTVATLKQRAPASGFAVTVAAPVAAADGTPCSSTRIRELLRAGEPGQAAALLGRPWSIEGVVEAGDRRGRQLGFPTANLDLGEHLRPAFGVYAVRATMQGNGAAPPLAGVANLGLRPTIGDGKVLLEAHLFDFAGDLYGQRLTLELVAFLRPERRFDGLEALKAQIAADSAAARALLAALTTPAQSPP